MYCEHLIIQKKTQGNALAAALENYKLIEDAYDTAEGSAGSARQEQEAWEKSLEASVQKFKASAETLAHTFLDSGVLDFFIELGTTGVKALDGIIGKFGSLGTIAGTVAGILSYKKNIGKVYKRTFSYCFEYAPHA